MKIRSGTEQVEALFPDAPPGKLEVKNQTLEMRRVGKRRRTLFAPHFESATRMELTLGPTNVLKRHDNGRNSVIRFPPGSTPGKALDCGRSPAARPGG